MAKKSQKFLEKGLYSVCAYLCVKPLRIKASAILEISVYTFYSMLLLESNDAQIKCMKMMCSFKFESLLLLIFKNYKNWWPIHIITIDK